MSRSAVLVALAVLAAAPAAAQSPTGPALAAGSELAVRVNAAVADEGWRSGAITWRRAGAIGLSLSAGEGRGLRPHQFAEAGVFGALPGLSGRLLGLELGWMAAAGYGEGGAYVPVGLGVSRAVEVRGARVTPYANVRVGLFGLDPFEKEYGQARVPVEVGADVRVTDRWSVRASAITSSGLGIGFALAH